MKADWESTGEYIMTCIGMSSIALFVVGMFAPFVYPLLQDIFYERQMLNANETRRKEIRFQKHCSRLVETIDLTQVSEPDSFYRFVYGVGEAYEE